MLVQFASFFISLVLAAHAFPVLAQVPHMIMDPRASHGAERDHHPTPTLKAHFTTNPIILDGILDEDIWQTGDVATNLWQFFPTDTAKATYQTEVRIAFDDEFLYVAIRAEAENGDFVVSSLQRDFSGTRNDNVAIFFDTFQDGANAFAFGITPFGVRREFLVSNGGATREGYNFTWDVKWRGESRRYDDHYTAEMAIPLTSIKFPEGSDTWRFRTYRFNVQSNETSTWARVPQSQLLGNLAFMGELHFDRPLGKSRTPLALIPYINAQVQRDISALQKTEDLGVGGDAKISIGDGLALDLTINPDFSQVEVDAIFTNLTRFSIRLPEQRQFFIDNSDMFSSFGDYYGGFQPFFSRRIGLARDTAGNLIQNKIIAGARLSGKLNENWRIGALNIQTAADESNEIFSNNNSMLALQRRIGARSAASGFIVNRQTFGNGGRTSDVPPEARFNRVVGAEYLLASTDGAWNGKTFIHKSFDSGGDTGGLSMQASGVYNKKDWIAAVDVTFVGADFDADLGFIPRKDFLRTAIRGQRFMYPKNRTILNRYSVEGLLLNIHRPSLDYRYTDFERRITGGLDFTNQSTLELSLRQNFIYLAEPFDPTRTAGSIALPGDADYRFTDVSAEYASNATGLFTYSASATAGDFFNGNRYGAGVSFGYRFQPFVSLGASLNYDGIRLPDPFPSADLWLATTRMEITFTRSIFWTTLVQYSNQRENLGINSRLQWRYAPLSDLFLVYNDSFDTSNGWSSQFRSLNLKVSYWLNL